MGGGAKQSFRTFVDLEDLQHRIETARTRGYTVVELSVAEAACVVESIEDLERDLIAAERTRDEALDELDGVIGPDDEMGT
jgi:DNA-binding IclR family transcriptional regulator